MREPWHIHTVVFDLDDTLYPERDYVLSGFRAVDVWLGANRNVTGFYNHAFALFDQGRRGKIFDEALAELGLSATPELVGELLRVYRGHDPQITLPSEADELLRWCVTRFKLGLITDGYREVQEKKIAALGLESRIPCRIVTDALGREFWKPHPEAFRRVMAHFGGEASGFVYVADNPRKDFIAPKALGWRTVRLRRAGGEHADYTSTPAEAADCEVTSWRDLRTLFEPPSVAAS